MQAGGFTKATTPPHPHATVAGSIYDGTTEPFRPEGVCPWKRAYEPVAFPVNDYRLSFSAQSGSAARKAQALSVMWFGPTKDLACSQLAFFPTDPIVRG